MQIRPTASASGLIINFSIALFHVYTEFGIDSFKWLKLVDTQINDDNSYSYQLKVNPEDNPELFSAA